MFSTALAHYLARLGETPSNGTRIGLDSQGRAQGKFFNATLTSAFQPIAQLDGRRVLGFEGYARSGSAHEPGLSVWRLLDGAATDDESVELDRLCRMLHAINFYRQAPRPELDLFLAVHARLLAAVDSAHGTAFRRVLDALELPHQKVVLQLPAASPNQRWSLKAVSDNYKRNGFRVALNAVDAPQGLELLEQIGPDVIKLDGRQLGDGEPAARLLREAAARGVRVVFKRVETPVAYQSLLRIGAQVGQAVLAQGFLWGQPASALPPASVATTAPRALGPTTPSPDAHRWNSHNER